MDRKDELSFDVLFDQWLESDDDLLEDEILDVKHERDLFEMCFHQNTIEPNQYKYTQRWVLEHTECLGRFLDFCDNVRETKSRGLGRLRGPFCLADFLKETKPMHKLELNLDQPVPTTCYECAFYSCHDEEEPVHCCRALELKNEFEDGELMLDAKIDPDSTPSANRCPLVPVSLGG